MTSSRSTDPNEPIDPGEPFDPIDPIFDGPAMALAGLTVDQPLALFPVRLATRFVWPKQNVYPSKLQVRMFPDLIHADGHLAELTEEELAIGHAYWGRWWVTEGDARNDARRWLVSQLGAPRATWVAKVTQPTNLAKAPDAEPDFPKLTARKDARPTMARLLPDYWHVTLRRGVEDIERVWSTRVRADLAMAPNLSEIPTDGGIRDLLTDQDLWWMASFDEAVAAGMAVEVPFGPSSEAPYVTELLVFGIRSDSSADDTELLDLLDAHRFTNGVEFIAQGTPTNNTDTVASPFTDEPTNLEGYFARQIEDIPAPRPPLLFPNRLGTISSANASSIALGLEAANAFDRAEDADRPHGAAARDMNRVLWPVTIGRYFRQLLSTAGQSPIPGPDLDWLAGWFTDWVRGPGLLPVLRIGSQPYGLLPVLRRPDFTHTFGSSRIEQLRETLYLGDVNNVPLGVAHFSDPVGAPLYQPPTPEEEAYRLAAVLGAVPHPTAFRLRDAPDTKGVVTGAWDSAIDEMENLLSLTPSALQDTRYWDPVIGYEDQIKNGNIYEQIWALDDLRWHANDRADYYNEATSRAVADWIDAEVRPLLKAHQSRSAVAFTYDTHFSDRNLPTATDPDLWYIIYGGDGAAADGTFPPFRLAPSEAGADVAAELRGFAEDARTMTLLNRPKYPVDQAAPLLYKLIEQTIGQVPLTDAQEVADGLDGLADHVETMEDPSAELGRLLRESLGPAMYRMDAWHSSVANQQLAALRSKDPLGIQVGAYGWVENLVPDENTRGNSYGQVDSAGYIHAPSLDHAATAAVLRSAWLNYADSSLDAPFGVDLSSDRVRRAQWLLDGVRNGVELGELLGARFERRLHDTNQANLVADVREEVLAAAGDDDEAPTAIVDGLALAVAYREDDLSDPVRAGIDTIRQGLPKYPNDRLGMVLSDTVADLDATADLLTAQSVHAVLKGRLDEAAATLSVAGSGAAGIPELRVPKVHRESSIITHRVVAVLADEVPKPTSVLAAIEPRLVAWLDDLLPGIGDIPVEATVQGHGSWQTTLGALGVGAAELVALASVGGDPGTGVLGTLLATLARNETRAEDTAAVAFPNGKFTDALTAAGTLRAAIGNARPLAGSDIVVAPDIPEPGDATELDGRRTTVSAILKDLSAIEGLNVITSRLGDLAILAPGPLALLLRNPDDKEAAIALTEAVKAAVEGLAAPLPDDWNNRSDAARVELMVERLSDVMVAGLPVLPVFAASNVTELDGSLALSDQRTGNPIQAQAWLLETGYTHDGVGLMVEALELAEATRGTVLPRPAVLQLPHRKADPWVAQGRPSDHRSRLHVVSVTDAAPLIKEPVAGLLFDSWTEPIPGPDATTGLAIHFDSPGARPPQAVLLATTLANEQVGWTVEELETVVVQTLELARMRAIGPETMDRWGHALPATFLDARTAVSATPAPDRGDEGEERE